MRHFVTQLSVLLAAVALSAPAYAQQPSPQAMTGTGEMTFGDDSYTGVMKMNMAQGAMSMKMEGKRLGDCTN